LAIWGILNDFRQRGLWAQDSNGPLNALIETAEMRTSNQSESFVFSALRAAKGTQSSHRRTILTDVAQVLSCRAEDLDFLFNTPVMAANDSDPVAMPDYRETLRR